ncbi:MAG: hypothetical protein KGL39_35645 [Patescibacteria group bacterium]|nr:hypothetical protein [Patescibacteria group bacterium]
MCKNCRFQLTTVATRYGLQTAMQGPNQAPISGLASLIYTPENPGETLFQRPIAFDTDGYLLVENPVGSGRLVRIQGPLVTQPANAHAIFTECYNRALIAFSDLESPVSPIEVYGLATKELDPYGQLPLGSAWTDKTAYIVNNYVQPTVTGGNGHLYRCSTAGISGAAEPVWPLTEGGTVTDGTAVWTEMTPVLANRLPAPGSPLATRVASGGTFPAGRDVYLLLTYVNPQGESVPSGPGVLVNTNLDDAARIILPALASLPGWIKGLSSPYLPTGFKVYEADVATGSAAPPNASYALVGSFAFGATVTVTASASGAAPPVSNKARVTPGGLQPPLQPTVIRASAAGTFPAGRDVYIIATATNAVGETLPSTAGVIVNTVLDDAVQVPIPTTQYVITGMKLYEADVPTGNPAPATSAYALVGSFQPNTTATITVSASGPPPPTVNTSGPPGSIAPDTADLNDTGAQGLRYASIAFTNRNGNLSGTVPAFTSIDVDLPGYELYMANIPIGPENIVNRTIGFGIADGTDVGPFFYIPSATVSNGVTMTATVIPDNTSTTAFFNFTDEFLQAETSTDMTDRLRCILPPPAVDVYYSPSIDRVVLTGVDGYASGHYISLAADSESYYGDTSPIQVANGNGQKCICAREYLGTLYSLKERSGFTISPSNTDPSSWSVQQRWDGVGPCGPRAVCVTNEFLMFVHRSGVYIYTAGQPQPELITKELPGIPGCFWSTVNWDAEETVWCSVDEENKEVRIGLPVGTATAPNICLTLNYQEGLAGPIHFSQFIGKEIATGGARKWSVDDIAGFCAVRCERPLATNASPFGSQRQSQVLIASSSPDGTVQQVATGVYNDNGQGIDCQYEGVCDPGNMAVSMLGGMSINANGSGAMKVSVMVMRSYTTDPPPQGAQGALNMTNEIRMPDFPLIPNQWKGYSQGARGQNERFRPRFTNGKTPDAWFALKYCNLFTRPIFSGRTAGGN